MLYSREFGDGLPILVLHGGGLDHRHMLDAIEPAFGNQSGWRRIYLDLPGHGLSPADDELRTQDDVLDRVVSHIVAEFGTKPIALIGESRGSYIAEGICAHHPDMVRGACLIVPGGNTPDSPRPTHQTLVAAPEVHKTLSTDVRPRFERLVVQSAKLAEKIVRTKIPAFEMHDTALAHRIGKNFEWSPPENPAPIDKPSLIISGRQDSIAGYQDALSMLPQFPRASFALLDTAGHSLAWERPELFACLLQDWLMRMSD